jgi:hypothetical protein
MPRGNDLTAMNQEAGIRRAGRLRPGADDRFSDDDGTPLEQNISEMLDHSRRRDHPRTHLPPCAIELRPRHVLAHFLPSVIRFPRPNSD